MVEETNASPSKQTHKVNEDIPVDDDVRLLDFTTASLGIILVALTAIFIQQAGELYNAYLDLTETKLEGRGVARIRLGNGFQNKVALHVERNEPFVVRNCLALTAFWDDDSSIIEAVGADALLPVRVAERKKDAEIPTQFRRGVAPGSRGEESAYLERNMTISEFMDVYSNLKSNEHLYAAQVNVMSALPGFLPYIKEIEPPASLLEVVGKTPSLSHRPISLYIGVGPLTTQTHYDSLENIVCVVSGGTKTFRLYDPPTAKLLLYVNRAKHGNGSPVPPDEPSNKEFPMARYALPSVVQLEKGDCLYLPVYWYHSVTSSADRTISINWWRKPSRNKMVVLEGLFCGNDEFGASAKCK